MSAVPGRFGKLGRSPTSGRFGKLGRSPEPGRVGRPGRSPPPGRVAKPGRFPGSGRSPRLGRLVVGREPGREASTAWPPPGRDGSDDGRFGRVPTLGGDAGLVPGTSPPLTPPLGRVAGGRAAGWLMFGRLAVGRLVPKLGVLGRETGPEPPGRETAAGAGRAPAVARAAPAAREPPPRPCAEPRSGVSRTAMRIATQDGKRVMASLLPHAQNRRSRFRWHPRFEPQSPDRLSGAVRRRLFRRSLEP